MVRRKRKRKPLSETPSPRLGLIYCATGITGVIAGTRAEPRASIVHSTIAIVSVGFSLFFILHEGVFLLGRPCQRIASTSSSFSQLKQGLYDCFTSDFGWNDKASLLHPFTVAISILEVGVFWEFPVSRLIPSPRQYS